MTREFAHDSPEPPGFAVDAATAIRNRRLIGGRLLVWMVLVCLLAFVIWAYYAAIDEVVRGSGRVVPSSQVQVVQNLEGGIVERIHVAEGDMVGADQVLLEIDDTRFGSSLQESRLRELALKAKAARLRAEAEGLESMPDLPVEITEALPGVSDQERHLFADRQGQHLAKQRILMEQKTQKEQSIQELKVRRSRLRKSLSLSERELKMTRPLRDQGAVSDVEVLRLQRQVNDLAGEFDEAKLAIPRAEAELGEVEQRLVELDVGFRKEAQAELNDVMTELTTLAAGNVALEDRVQRTQVRSPIRGVVKSLLITTVGGVVQPGMDLLEIVPVGDNLLVEARVRPKDIAFLRPDLPARVKLTAYDFAIYGALDAQVEHISADTFLEEDGEPFYVVRVRTHDSAMVRNGKTLTIIPGMTAEVDILVGEKTVLNYLLKPILRARENALREP